MSRLIPLYALWLVLALGTIVVMATPFIIALAIVWSIK